MEWNFGLSPEPYEKGKTLLSPLAPSQGENSHKFEFLFLLLVEKMAPFTGMLLLNFQVQSPAALFAWAYNTQPLRNRTFV